MVSRRGDPILFGYCSCKSTAVTICCQLHYSYYSRLLTMAMRVVSFLFLLLFCISVFHHVEILQWPSMRNNPLLLFAIINIFNCITKRSGQYIVMFIIAVFVSDSVLLVYCAFYIRFCFVFLVNICFMFFRIIWQ